MINTKKLIADLAKTYAKRDKQIFVSSAAELRDLDPKNFLPMPEWWTEATNTPGLPYGKAVHIAGDSDTGKTSFCIVAMKHAQTLDIPVIYIETEGKTMPHDFTSWGVKPDDLIMIRTAIAEELYQQLFDVIDLVYEADPKSKLLIVIDSLGNVISKHDKDMDMAEDSQRPGGKGRVNRAGINRLESYAAQKDIATIICNYTYDNIGSAGKTNAGGKALNFFSSITYQTSRVGWLDKQGEKRNGARVKWTRFKNHANKPNPGPKSITLDITAEGMKLHDTE